MVRLFSLTIFYERGSDVYRFASAYQLSSFEGVDKRADAAKNFDKISRETVEKTLALSDARVSMKEEDYMCHVFVRDDKLTGVLIADEDYPQGVAFTLLSKVLDDFCSTYPSTAWPTLTPDQIIYPACEIYIAEYGDPSRADNPDQLQADIDRKKSVVVKAVDVVVDWEDRLDAQDKRTDELFQETKTFKKEKKRKCCVII